MQTHSPRNMNVMTRTGGLLANYWKVIVFVLTPFLASPVLIFWHPVEGDNIPKVTYTILIMAVYWITEVSLIWFGVYFGLGCFCSLFTDFIEKYMVLVVFNFKIL